MPLRWPALVASGVGTVALGAALAAATRALIVPSEGEARAGAAMQQAAPFGTLGAVTSPLPPPVLDDELPRRASKVKRAGALVPPPDDLQRGEIVAAMERVKPRAARCYAEYKQPGTATVKMTISSTGRVASARVLGELEGTDEAACVEAAAKGASFRSFKRPSLSLTWPFVLRDE